MNLTFKEILTLKQARDYLPSKSDEAIRYLWKALAAGWTGEEATRFWNEREANPTLVRWNPHDRYSIMEPTAGTTLKTFWFSTQDHNGIYANGTGWQQAMDFS